MYVRAYLATLYPYGNNNKIQVCRPKKKNRYVFDKKINEMK